MGEFSDINTDTVSKSTIEQKETSYEDKEHMEYESVKLDIHLAILDNEKFANKFSKTFMPLFSRQIDTIRDYSLCRYVMNFFLNDIEELKNLIVKDSQNSMTKLKSLEIVLESIKNTFFEQRQIYLNSIVNCANEDFNEKVGLGSFEFSPYKIRHHFRQLKLLFHPDHNIEWPNNELTSLIFELICKKERSFNETYMAVKNEAIDIFNIATDYQNSTIKEYASKMFKTSDLQFDDKKRNNALKQENFLKAYSRFSEACLLADKLEYFDEMFELRQYIAWCLLGAEKCFVSKLWVCVILKYFYEKYKNKLTTDFDEDHIFEKYSNKSNGCDETIPSVDSCINSVVAIHDLNIFRHPNWNARQFKLESFSNLMCESINVINFNNILENISIHRIDQTIRSIMKNEVGGLAFVFAALPPILFDIYYIEKSIYDYGNEILNAYKMKEEVYTIIKQS